MATTSTSQLATFAHSSARVQDAQINKLITCAAAKDKQFSDRGFSHNAHAHLQRVPVSP